MPKSKVESLERGYSGTSKTIDKMHRLVELGKLDPTLQKIAYWIRASVPGDARGSSKKTADAIFNWVAKHGMFVRDPFQIERLEHPVESMRPLIEARKAGTYKGRAVFSGDCDTFTIMVSTLGGVLGFQHAFETAKVDAERPDEFSHVWAALRIGKDWYPLDPSTPGVSPGWRPPVSPDLFARWPEKPIEDVVGGKDMRGLNGFGLGQNGNGRPKNGQANGNYVPSDYFGYGIPHSIGNGPLNLPVTDPADILPLIPREPELSMPDEDPEFDLIRRIPLKGPAHRIGPSGEQPNDHGPPYYRGEPSGPPAGTQPYYKTERSPYPPGSLWNRKFMFLRGSYPRPYVNSQESETPVRNVKIVMEQPMRIIRRPQQMPEGTMGQLPLVSLAPTVEQTEAVKIATTESKSIWDTISETIQKALPAATETLLARTNAYYAEKVAKATQKATGVPVTPQEVQTGIPGAYMAEKKPWYSSPWVWIGGAIVVGGTAYALTRD